MLQSENIKDTLHTYQMANVAELLMRQQGAFITGADFLIDGDATASYFYGPLNHDAK